MEDFDLTPPEERRAQLWRRRLMVVALGGALLLFAVWYGALPASHAIKAWQSRRLAREASAYIEKAEWTNATNKARNAYQLDPTEPAAWRAIGHLLSRTGQNAAALEWWRKIDEAGKLTLNDRREYAGSALGAGELATAEAQINPLLAQPKSPAPADMLLAGNLASRRANGAQAYDYAESTLADNRSKPNEILSATILILSVTPADSQPYISAWNRIEELARDAGNVMQLDALVFLAQQPAAAPQAKQNVNGTLSLAQMATETRLTTMSAGEIARGLENHPQTRPYHQLLALKLRAREEPPRADEFLEQAVGRFRGGDDEALLLLNTWLYTQGRYQTMLEVMPMERASRRRELYLQYLDALGALGRFQEVRQSLESHQFNLDSVSEHMYLAIARSQLGEETGTANEWQRALEGADDDAKCMVLGSFAERASASDIADRAYAQAISFAPKSRAAYEGRLRLARSQGHTARAKQVLTEICRVWPDDDHARNDKAYVELLMGANGEDAEKALRESQILLAREPMNWQARATVALAHLKLGRPAAALGAFRGVKAVEGDPVGPLAVRAAALDANGWKEGARGDAHTLAASPLLPEERALIAPLLRD